MLTQHKKNHRQSIKQNTNKQHGLSSNIKKSAKLLPQTISKRRICRISTDDYRKDSSPSYNKVQVLDILLRGSLIHTSHLLKSQQITSEQLIETTIEQIKDTNPITNAYITVCDQNKNLDLAIESDQRYKLDSSLPLDGIPISIKDNFHVNGEQTTAGSQFLKGMQSHYDATIVSRLKQAGAIIIGKTNLDEFGMGSYGVNSSYGKSISIFDTQQQSNPQHQYIPGGSSSGSAVSLQQYTAFASIGSDTGGSVRLPAAFTGIVGFKPTYGALSRYGLIAYGSSLDCPGILTRTVADAKLIFNIVNGIDENDSTCIFDTKAVQTHFPQLFSPSTIDSTIPRESCGPVDTNTTSSMMGKPTHPLKGVKVGIPIELMFSDLSTDIKQMWSDAANLFTSLGAEVYSISIPTLAHSLPVYYTLAQSEAVSNLARYEGLRYGNTHYTNEQEYQIGFYQKSTESEPILNNNEKTIVGTQPSQPKDTKLAQIHNKSVNIGEVNDPNISPLQKLYSTNRQLFFGQEVKQRLLVGNFVLSSSHYNSYIEKSMQLRKELTMELLSTLYTTDLNAKQRQEQHNETKVDILLTPTSTVLPPTLTEQQEISKNDNLSAYVDDVMTVFANLAGVPAISLPFTTATGNNGDKLPIGIQLIGAPCADNQLLDIAQIIQKHVKF